jgi:photosystem II stability/assembly factor-like uncharacterized protein
MKYLIVLFSIIWGFAVGQPKSDGRIYLSDDRGVNWSQADNGLPSGATVNAWVTTDGIVIAGTERHGIFISSDRMKSWYSSSKGLPVNTRILSTLHAGNLLFAGTHVHGLYSSDNGGESWHPVNKGLHNLTIRALYYLDRNIFAGTDKGLFVSQDAGGSWNLLLKGLQINSLTSEKHELFVATNNGVLRTFDLGINWQWIFSEGAIYSLTTDINDIYLLSYSGKVYKSSREQYVWIKADLFLPFHYTFRITPEGRQFFTSDWRRVIKGISSTNEVFWANGIPENVYINEMLDTPYGVLVAGRTVKK